MHAYHVDFDIRRRLYLMAGVSGLLLAWLFHWLVDLRLNLGIPWWVESPSVLAFSSFSWWLLDNYVWKAPVLRKIPALYIPDLSGGWNAEIRSSYSGFAETSPATVIIRQTASRICISLQGQYSRSSSFLAAILKTEQVSTYELSYLYQNEPKVDSLDSMNAHEGTCTLRITDDPSVLEGEYYSGRGRVSLGTIILRRLASA